MTDADLLTRARTDRMMTDRLNFTDGKPWIVSEADTKKAWNGGKDGAFFRCALCGHKFVAGDTARWQFTNDTPGAGGNPMVCVKCDGGKEAIVAEIRKRREELKAPSNWWFLPKVQK